MKFKKINIEDVEDLKFYWTPPKKFYDKNPADDFFENEYTFVLYTGYMPKTSYVEDRGITIRSNSLEIEDKIGNDYESDRLPDAFETHYFFEIDQSKVPDEVKRPVLLFIFNSDDPFNKYLQEIPEEW
jgi:hypothetical protein